jgi:hypothetical protein
VLAKKIFPSQEGAAVKASTTGRQTITSGASVGRLLPEQAPAMTRGGRRLHRSVEQQVPNRDQLCAGKKQRQTEAFRHWYMSFLQ